MDWSQLLAGYKCVGGPSDRCKGCDVIICKACSGPPFTRLEDKLAELAGTK